MTRHRPQNVTAAPEGVRIALVYKNFAAHKGVSHIGLGVAALNTSLTLRNLGYWVDVWPCNTAADIKKRLDDSREQAVSRGEHPVSHVVISAPWLAPIELQGLLSNNNDVEFAVVSHSNIGFLMADPNGIRLLRAYIELEAGHHNFVLGGNCEKFVKAWTQMYGARMIYLPNLYDVTSIRSIGTRQPWHHGQPLRIGVFGATRPLKNMVSATAAAVELGTALKNDVEIWISSGRDEGAGTVKQAMTQLVTGLPHTKIVQAGWRSWPDFRAVVRNMHVLLQPSYTESFCMIVADGIAEGVASVVGEAVDWAPLDWVANTDNVNDIARTARRLLLDPYAVNEGQAALRRYVLNGSQAWTMYLAGNS
jgi:hypothetical protein